MADHALPTPDLSTAAVLIAAHGSPGSAGGRSATRRHAETLANLEIFAQVGAGFLTEKPFVADVLDTMDNALVYVVPNMAADGFITREKLPAALGLTGQVSERIGPKGRQRVVLTEAVGTHPLVAKFMADGVHAALRDLDVDHGDAALVVVGHGSTKSRANAAQTEKVAAALPQYGLALPIVSAFLEETPKVQDWRGLTSAKTVLFAPFLISDGFHATQDIPLAIGFDPADDAFQATLAQGRPVQIVEGKRRLIYLSPVGDAPHMADVILARVKQAHAALP